MFDNTITICGQQLTCCAERAVFWDDRKTLWIADPHFGKPSVFRGQGIAVPGGTTADDLRRLTAVVDRTGAQRIVILGDLGHAPASEAASVGARIGAWRDAHRRLEMVLILGNHDERSDGIAAAFQIDHWAAELPVGPFLLRHRPGPSKSGYVISGHVHPAVRLSRRGRQRLTLPCFYFGPCQAILPAFGSFTGSAEIRPEAGSRVLIPVENAVIEPGDGPPDWHESIGGGTQKDR